MKVLVVTPAPPGSRSGNRVTALRWAGFLRGLGHRVTVATSYDGGRWDLLLALHARRSAEAVARFRKENPSRPVVLGLTGTDVYGDIHTDPAAQRSLELADRYVVLQPLAVEELPSALRPRARVIFQSVRPPAGRFTPRRGVFEVVVLAHLRAVKDPLRAARASRLLPASSRIRVVHAGGVVEPDLAEEARREVAANPRYEWRGELARWRALRLLARARLLVLSSRSEGGANVVSEALAVGTPILSSRIAGSVGILGEGYPGYFDVGDTEGLAELLRRAEADTAWYGSLRRHCRARAAVVDPDRERAAWESMIEELVEEGYGDH